MINNGNRNMLTSETRELQNKFTLYCRTGKKEFIPEVDKPQHVHHYRRLTFNITKNTLSNAYPLLKKFLSQEQWQELMYDYFSEHKCQNNKIWLMPKELYNYVVEKNLQTKWNIPFLNDLLHFEWIEIEVHTMPDMTYPKFQENGRVWNDVLAINPEFRLVQFNYPVHKKKTAEVNENDKGLYYLLAYREQESGKVQFISISALYAFVIEQISNGYTLDMVFEAAAELFNFSETDKIKEKITDFIDRLKERRFILGFKL